METLSRWTTQKLKLIFLLLVLLKQAGAILTDEERLHRDLFTNYSADTHPTLLPNESVLVIFDIQIIRIIDVSEKFQYIKTYAWINQYWNNSLLEWDPMKYGGIKEIHVAPRKVWVPDILLYNNVDNEDRLGGGLETYKANVAIYNTGRNKWLNPAMFKSICSVDVNYFPFDDQQCKMKFGSWSFDKSKLDMVPSISDGYSEYYIANGEWELISIDIERNAKVYQCCEHPFIDVTATIKLRRESVDYMLKLIIPCLLISSMIFLGFILPPESGERIGLSITVLLAMTVFQQLTSEIMPSYGFPLLGQYYFAIMMEIGISLVVTTLILNFYHRNTMNMPKIMKLILKLIARVLFPFKKRRKKSESVNEPDKPSDVTKSSEESLSFDESLFEDDRNSPFTVESHAEDVKTRSSIMESINGLFGRPTIIKNNQALSTFETTITGDTTHHQTVNDNKANEGIELTFRNGNATHDISGNRLPAGQKKRRGFEEVAARTIARRKRQRARNKRDWLKAARVLDRLFLILSMVTGIVTIFAIFLKAPRFQVHLGG